MHVREGEQPSESARSSHINRNYWHRPDAGYTFADMASGRTLHHQYFGRNPNIVSGNEYAGSVAIFYISGIAARDNFVPPCSERILDKIDLVTGGRRTGY